MEEKVNIKSAKRFGQRYGRTLREAVALIEIKYKKSLKCPYCRKTGVKRVAVGIWQCRKCNSRFTAKAYSLE